MEYWKDSVRVKKKKKPVEEKEKDTVLKIIQLNSYIFYIILFLIFLYKTNICFVFVETHAHIHPRINNDPKTVLNITLLTKLSNPTVTSRCSFSPLFEKHYNNTTQTTEEI